ncbi:hypothetical protein J2Z40_003807 [Cytobacillus eiseniae]|uniref:Uncharacterized protein n=1 Tax=Cytobacillus eiseniae TaxID=762947 RepID=A0ABS4RJX9_9BACI|nr:hypothetical protein [Cytobacillus eiseniae]MBP2243219.1 hypothetical protein [Cytobacillus eiseniae]
MATIKFKQFTIDRMKDSSAVFSGNNFQHKFSSSIRKAEGNGAIIGDHNLVFNNIHTVKNKTQSSETE